MQAASCPFRIMAMQHRTACCGAAAAVSASIRTAAPQQAMPRSEHG